MQKLFRSLIAVGGLAGLVACGDDVSVVAPSDPLTISGAPVTAISIGSKVQLSASEAATWVSSDATVASVDGTGLVSAIKGGVASITATATADPNKKASVTITVTALVNAAISVQNITVTGTPGNTVNANNVAGSIDVNLNVVPGDQVVQRVEVLLDGNIACTQNLTGAQAAVSAEAALDPLDAVIVSCQINTADFNAATGAVKYLNGSHALSARAIITGGTQTATPSQSLIFNNQSGFIGLVSNVATNAGAATSAINPVTGRKWIGGNVTLKLAAVNYVAGGATVTSVNGAFLGKTLTGETPDAGTQIFTIDFPNSGTGPLNIVGYETSVLSETMPLVTSSNLSTGNPGPTAILNIGPKADSLGLTRLDSTRVDNVAPAAPTVGTFTTWVNAAFKFDTTSAAITNVNDTGVDNVTAEFFVIKGTLPTTACDVTGMTKVTTGTSLTETLSTEYRAKAILADALGNRRCVNVGAGSLFGADFGAPSNVTLAGVLSQQGFTNTGTAAGTFYTINTDGDTLSGIPPTNPALISILRTGVSSGTNACVIGTGTFSACVPVPAAISASVTGGSTTEGYYTITAQLTDVAGNAAPTPAISRTFVVDANAPTFSGGLSLAGTYAGNAPAVISSISVADNLDLATLFAAVNYSAAGVVLEYPSTSIGTFGTPLEKTFAGSYTIPSLIRCMAPGPTGPYAANNANKAQDIAIVATDQAGNFGVKSPVAGDFVARVANCGVVGNLTAPLVLSAFNQSLPDYGTGKTQVDIDGANLVTASSTTVALAAVADVSQNGGNPFSRVEFYFLNPTTGGFVLIGTASATAGNNTSPTRPWNFLLNWNPGAEVPTGSVTVIAIGVDAEGDAAASQTQTVTIVP